MVIMKTRIHSLAAASLLAAGAALLPAHAQAGVRICTFPGSPSTTLDQAVAREAFKTAGIAASFDAHAIGDGDDDGVSLKELRRTLEGRCDVIAGFPRSAMADAASHSTLVFSRGYLHSGYVSIEARGGKLPDAAKDVIAATFASPAQLIALQQKNTRIDLVNTHQQTVDAVASGHAQRAIVWYPAVVAYRQAHPQRQFDVARTASPYADWDLVIAFKAADAELQERIDAALSVMSADGRLATLTRNWALPEGAPSARVSAPAFAYLDGPHVEAGQMRDNVRRTGGMPATAAIVKIGADGDAPSFDGAQAKRGKALYSNACAKCHGAQLQGVTAPALSGPSFAPAANSKLTIGGIFSYLSTNMPADRPGKLKEQEYADIMAFLLYSNGYRANASKDLADAARASTTPLNAGPGR